MSDILLLLYLYYLMRGLNLPMANDGFYVQLCLSLPSKIFGTINFSKHKMSAHLNIIV